MSEDFYIKYRGATQPRKAGGYRTLREPQTERVNALLQLLFELIRGDFDPGESHSCPICRRDIKIAFEYYKEFPNELDILTFCNTCEMNVFFKSNKIPTWAKEVSLKDLPLL